MKNVNALIGQRLNKASSSTKMTALAERSANGQVNSFAGLFSPAELTETEKAHLQELLASFSHGTENIKADFNELSHITSEVKAINNQAAMLHGERIKKAQAILKSYRDGAFTAWMIAIYGNRQTPYNLMQYYEFYESLPKPLQPKLESMPRQAVYTLASREGAFDIKKGVVEKYDGETKSALLSLIRDLFPLEDTDKRKINTFQNSLSGLAKVRFTLSKLKSLSPKQKEELNEELSSLKKFIDLIKVR